MSDTVIKTIYNKFRPFLPRKIGSYNGVAVRWPRLGDRTDVKPAWKDGTVSAVKAAVKSGDSVIEIGTGFGVCTVWAARRAGGGGVVVTYEASDERKGIAEETAVLNGVENNITVNHAAVGPTKEVFGEMRNPDHVYPTDLPDCDVLISDSEGAEVNLVQHLDEIDPREAVIETHGHRGAPTNEVREIIESHGYELVSSEPAMGSQQKEDNMALHVVKEVSDDR